MREYECLCGNKFKAKPDVRTFGDVECPMVNCPKCGEPMQVGEGKYYGPPTTAKIVDAINRSLGF